MNGFIVVVVIFPLEDNVWLKIEPGADFISERVAGQQMASSSLLVAAIDFGTTYSGAAVSFHHEYIENPTRIYALKIGDPRLSMKTKTCILVKPDGQTCYKFGDAAESYYYEQLDETERQKWYYFSRFKMELYQMNAENYKSFELRDKAGKSLSALKVFSLAIQWLKDQVLAHCSNRIVGTTVHDDISWVLTVPAIWDDKAKGFMREAAENAGIKREKLVVALEPESASIYCQHVPIVRDQPDIAKLVPFGPGKRYVILDCGGGTVDITVHEVTDKELGKKGQHKGNFIREIHRARGNDMGGTKVDDEFLKYLESVFGGDIMKMYREEEPDDAFELMRSFEDKKRQVSTEESKITFSTKLIELFAEKKGKSFKDHSSATGNTEVTTPARGKLRIGSTVAQGFFEKSIKSILDELRAIFEHKDCSECPYILMVGGFSESQLLQTRVREAFPEKTVICPNEAGLAVLKGAVIFGHNPGAISERISRFTYGTDLIFDGFSKLVGTGDKLQIGKSNKVEVYHALFSNATSIPVNIFVSPNENPTCLSEEGCVKIMPRTFSNPDGTKGFPKGVEMCMIFGGTEFKVKVKDLNTGYEETFYVSSWD